MRPKFTIDCFVERLGSYDASYALVAVDVIRATTSAITAVAIGRRCFPVPSVEGAFRLAARMPHALLAGEIAGDIPAGFDMNNSPSQLARPNELHRPLILLSSSGTRLLHGLRTRPAVYLACFRNAVSLADHLVCMRHSRIALIGAASRSEFREEDQICCVWIALGLMNAGYDPLNRRSSKIVSRWASAKPEAILKGKSAEYLISSGQAADLDFVLRHINDLQDIYTLRHGEVVSGPDQFRVKARQALATDQQEGAYATC